MNAKVLFKSVLATGLLLGVMCQGCGTPPAEFANANWAGVWRSEQTILVGELFARIPDPVPTTQPFDAEMMVCYPLMSPFRPGQNVRFKVEGRFVESGREVTGQETRPFPVADSRAGKGWSLLSLSSSKSGGDGTPGQRVSFQAKPDDRRTSFDGSYTSENPADKGEFTIYKR
jgi:hypothetical protein